MSKDEYRDTTFAELKKAHPSVRVEALPNLSDAENRQRLLQALDFNRLVFNSLLMLSLSATLTIAALLYISYHPADARAYKIILDHIWPNTNGTVEAAYAEIYSPAEAARHAEVFTLSAIITLVCGAIWLAIETIVIARRDRHWLPRTDLGGAPYGGKLPKALSNRRGLYAIFLLLTTILWFSVIVARVSVDNEIFDPNPYENIAVSCAKISIRIYLTYLCSAELLSLIIQYSKYQYMNLYKRGMEQ
ncbi:MAG TPA: hypothetical protein VIL84_14575 [Devosiaceae bacterium]